MNLQTQLYDTPELVGCDACSVLSYLVEALPLWMNALGAVIVSANTMHIVDTIAQDICLPLRCQIASLEMYVAKQRVCAHDSLGIVSPCFVSNRGCKEIEFSCHARLHVHNLQS